MATIAQITRLQNGVPDSVGVTVALDNRYDNTSGTGIAIRRDSDGATMLTTPEFQADTAHPIIVRPNGIFQYEYGFLNLDPLHDYTIFFRTEKGGAVAVYEFKAVAGAQSGRDPRATIRRNVGALILGRDKFAFGPVIESGPDFIRTRFARRYDSGFIKGRTLYITQGLGAGQDALIAEHTQGDGRMEVTPAWETIPGLNSVAEMWGDRVHPDDVNEAINNAIRDVSGIAKVKISATVNTFATDRRSFDIPTEFTHIYRIRYKPTGAYHWSDVFSRGEPYSFQARERVAYLNHALSSDVLTVQVDGYRRPRVLVTDSEVCEIDPAFVVYHAAYLLEAQAAEGRQLDPEEHAGRAGNWLRQALVLRNEIMEAWEPNTEPV